MPPNLILRVFKTKQNKIKHYILCEETETKGKCTPTTSSGKAAVRYLQRKDIDTKTVFSKCQRIAGGSNNPRY